LISETLTKGPCSSSFGKISFVSAWITILIPVQSNVVAALFLQVMKAHAVT
jgi:hypothetical protein